MHLLCKQILLQGFPSSSVCHRNDDVYESTRFGFSVIKIRPSTDSTVRRLHNVTVPHPIAMNRNKRDKCCKENRLLHTTHDALQTGNKNIIVIVARHNISSIHSGSNFFSGGNSLWPMRRNDIILLAKRTEQNDNDPISNGKNQFLGTH